MTIPEAKILANEYNISLTKFFEEIVGEEETTQNNTSPFSDHLAKCFKEEYFKLLKAYLKLCQDNCIEPDLK